MENQPEIPTIFDKPEDETSESELAPEVIEERRNQCNNLKQQGNLKFKDNCLEEAIDLYTQAIEICPKEDTKEVAVLYNNRAAAFLHMEGEEYLEKCIDDCSHSIELNPHYVKPYLKRGQAYRKMGKEKLDQALADYEKVIELEPTIKEAYPAINELKEEIDKRNEDLKNEMISKLKDMGNFVLNKFGMSTDNFQMVKNPETGSYSINFKS